MQPGVNFINVFCMHFSYESYVLAAFSSQNSTFVRKKNARKMLMKLTPALRYKLRVRIWPKDNHKRDYSFLHLFSLSLLLCNNREYCFVPREKKLQETILFIIIGK